MLIYWRHIFTDELYDVLNKSCTYEPCGSLRYSNFTETYVLTASDKFANYSVASLFVCGFFISSLLNPLIFYHFLHAKSSMVIVDMLFKILAVCDFITNIYSPLYYAHEMFHSEIQPSVKRTWTYIFAQGISCNVGCISQSATTLLAVARYLRIRSPFFRINKLLFLSLFLLYTAIMTGLTIAGKYLIYTASYEDVGRYTPAMDVLKDICFYLNLVQCFVGVLFSVLCVSTLFKMKPDSGEELAKKTHEMRKKGCVTILLINLPYLVSLCFAMVAAITEYAHLRSLMFTFLPVITSTLNPMILCWRNTGIHKRMKKIKQYMSQLIFKTKYEPEYHAEQTMMSAVLLDNNKTIASEI